MPNGYNNNIIKNKAFVEVEVDGKKRVIESNEVVAKKLKIAVIKEQSCRFVLDGDKIEYTVKILNFCDDKLYNVEFIDSFSDETEYEHGSFKVNGKKEQPIVFGHTLKYKIHELKEKEELEIKFEVKVD